MNILVDDIGKVVDEMRLSYSNGLAAPYYMYGHKKEINNRLMAKDKHKDFKWKRYPLVALTLDFPEDIANGLQSYTLNIGILEMTTKDYNAEERYTNVFKPILYPLYELFLKSLRNVGLFMWPGDQEYPPHTKLDRPFWGVSEANGNVRKIFTDPLDAIELVNLKVSQRAACLK